MFNFLGPVLRARLLIVFAVLLGVSATARADDAYGGAVEHMETPDAGHTPVLTKPPALLQRVEPIFPEEAKAQQLQGDVTMQVDIGADGKVTDVQVLQPAGHGFDEAAVAAVKQFTFSPAEIDNVPAPVRITYTEHFVWVAPVVDAGPPEEADAGEVDAGPQWPIRLAGRVLERASRKPIDGAQVEAESTEAKAAAITDADGKFELHLPPGNVGVTVRAANYQLYHTTENLTAKERLDVSYFLMPKTFGLYESSVRSQRDQKEVNRYTLDREELEKVPGSLGDPIRVIQDLPGVARAPFLSGQLIVRGSAPTDTGSYLDGVEIPLLFHFFGGPSVVNPEFLDRIDFFPGGFGPEYGRAIGGIVDVQTRAPKQDEWHGSAKIDLIDTGVYVAMPIAPGLTVSAAERRSYLDAVLGVALPIAGASVTVAPVYYDYQLRVDYQPPEMKKNKFKLFFFGSDDYLTVVDPGALPGGSDFKINDHQGFQRLQGAWIWHDGITTLSTAPYVGLDDLSVGVGQLQIDSNDVVVGHRENLELDLTKWFILRNGLDFELYRSTYDAHFPAVPLNYRPFPGEQPDAPLQELGGIINELDYGFWTEAEIHLPWRMKIFPGLRYDYYRLHGLSRNGIAPRLTIRQDFGSEDKPLTVKGAVGIYNESPGAQNLDPVFGFPDEPLQWAFQSSLGVEKRITDAINIDLTGFYNRRYDLAEPSNIIVHEPDGSVHRQLVSPSGLGRAYGLELLARHEITKHFFGWIAYTLSWSYERPNSDSDYAPSTYDERHILTLIAQYKFGNGW